ncbi:hypothetical protein GH733_004713, partial [Mirounga leonina]
MQINLQKMQTPRTEVGIDSLPIGLEAEQHRMSPSDGDKDSRWHFSEDENRSYMETEEDGSADL